MPRGSKSCPKCKKDVGPRTKICKCGHVFSQKTVTLQTKQRKEEKKKAEEIPLDKLYRRVFIPAGHCPISPLSPSRDDLSYWIESVRQWGYRQRIYYDVDAFVYWLRYFGEDFKNLGETIREIEKDKERRVEAAG